MSKARQVPYNNEAEMSVLGAIFLDPEKYAELAENLHENDFYSQKHRDLYSAMGSLALRGKLDLVTLKTELERRGVLERLGGVEYIVKLANFTPTSEGILEYAKIVRECSVRRTMIEGYSKVVNALYDPGKSVSKLTEYVQESIICSSGMPKRVSNFTDACGIFLDEIDKRQKSGSKFPGIETGFKVFDTMTGGLEDEKLYVIGARPSMGKTALALNIAANLARAKKTVMFFSLEMSVYEVTKRIMSYISGVKSGKLKTAAVSDEELISIVRQAERILPDKLFIDDNGYQTIGSIESTCMRINTYLKTANDKIDCVFIDHLHLMSSNTRTHDRRLQIGEISRGCKILASKLKCPVVLLSQLSRSGKDRKDPTPILSDLRESGDIEQDADVVAFIHREEYYQRTIDNEGKAQLILAKVRDGICGKIDLGWDAATTTFMPWYDYVKWKDNANNPNMQQLIREGWKQMSIDD